VALRVAVSAPVTVRMAVAATAVMANLFDLVAGLLVSVAELLRRKRRGRGGGNGETGGGETGGGGESDQSLVHGDLLLLSVGATVRRDRMQFAKPRLNRM
jgi:hypothetical protein